MKPIPGDLVFPCYIYTDRKSGSLVAGFVEARGADVEHWPGEPDQWPLHVRGRHSFFAARGCFGNGHVELTVTEIEV